MEKPPGIVPFIEVNHDMSIRHLNQWGNQQSQMEINNSQLVDRQLIGSGSGLTDDDFFHMTCHTDPVMRSKIELGKYIDLDKLLPKDSLLPGKVVASNEMKLEWVMSEGNTYLVPAKSTSRINCFHRWEQAFRMYAMIYCMKNPSRAREIWQYITVINTASLSYAWDNVYHYDVIFRQLMEFNPDRSWAVTYNQMWNLSMTNPLVSNQQHRKSFSNSNNGNVNSYSGGQPQKKKIDYCWSFNKGIKCKFGRKCKFIERCSYCDSPAHGVVSCDKLDKRDGAPTKANSMNSRKYKAK